MSNYPYTDYKKYIPEAFKRYMQQALMGQTPKGFVSGQVHGASAAINPFIRQAGSQYAANLGGRGGAGGGAGMAYSSQLQGRKIGAMANVAAGAQRNLLGAAGQASGRAQREGFQLSGDEKHRVEQSLRERMFQFQKWLEENNLKWRWEETLGDLLGAGAQGAGAYFGSRPPKPEGA